ncbi:MAG: O-antigen ligase family protein, partial [bacterium]|nr:O-antigen ligase family protein [bacterium]
MKLSAVARLAIKILLFGTALTPLIYAPQLIFPFVLGKMFFYRGAVEIAFILTALLFIVEYVRGTANAPDSLASRLRARSVFFKNPLFIAIAVFVFSAAVSVALAPNVYRGFFGGGERGEGFLGIFHYFLFLALALVFFRMRDWAVFAGIWLGTASVVMLYAWLQFFSWFRLFGAASFPFALDATDQPGSWTGNPAYLAGYLIISLALALFLYNGSTHSTSSGQASSPRGLTSSRVWRALLIGFFAAVPATVVMTGIRGAVLGVFAGGFALAIGFLFQRGTKRSFKIAALGLLAGLVTLGGVFWMTRGAEVWKVFPGIRRLAKADLLSTPSVATRLLALTVSWEAFKERPLFGWGLENYDIAYNKYYDPAYAFYAEDWFDRAHNRFVDTAVTQGVFGLLSYLVVLGIMFRKFWDNIWTSDAHIFGGGRMSAPLLSAIFVAYIVQNLFIFDQITTYIAFFALAGILIYREGDGSTSPSAVSSGPNCSPQVASPRASPPFSRFAVLALCAVLGVGTLASGYALYAWNFVPLRQAFRFHAVLSTKNGEKIFAATDSFF